MNYIFTLGYLLLTHFSFGQLLNENPADGLLCVNGAIPFWYACNEEPCADTVYYDDGSIKLVGQCKNDIKEGQWKAFYSNGNIMATGKIVESFPDGYWVFYHENGQKSAEGNFIKGQFELGCRGSENYVTSSCKIGTWRTWYSNGNPEYLIDYNRSTSKEEELHGNYLKFDTLGNVEIQGNHHHNEEIGPWVYWNNTGNQHVKRIEHNLEDTIQVLFSDGFEEPELRLDSEELNKHPEMIDYINWLKQEWDSVPNPLIATYEGNQMGDYFHVLFEDSLGNNYDFGFSNNDFGEYQLYSGEHYIDNPDYLNKKFKIIWGWKRSVFPCCSGNYERMEEYIPSIIELELIDP